jgi:hypothetical protein
MRSSALVIGVDAAIALMFETRDDDRDADDEVVLQGGALVGAALSELTLGVRLQLASTLTNDNDRDQTQVGVMPFLQADLRSGAFVHGGLLINLDDPVGPFGDNDLEVWALRVGAGARF